MTMPLAVLSYFVYTSMGTAATLYHMGIENAASANPRRTSMVSILDLDDLCVLSAKILNDKASWNGNDWNSLGNGVGDGVSALTVFEDELIVAGEFTAQANSPSQYIARWDGSKWQPMGEGLNGFVFSFTFHEGKNLLLVVIFSFRKRTN